MNNDFLSSLNLAQREAVEYCDGPSLVIAGAGSGKTRVLTYKIAHLINQGMAPWKILALTFTNKAANEMKERIDGLVGGGMSSALWMGTFHSIFNRILRQESSVFGFTPNYTIYQPSDSQSLVKNIIKDLGLDIKKYKEKNVCERISEAKNALIL
ncbi:MAG: UvrD-helicase domain-containing protein, partial [Prevotellaceae bacterium]|nr:UvrD-helicase domain-containing protein [Candidatus Faecinaster equi]